MNPFDLSASELMIWGFVLHLMADWLFQSSWMADNKMKRRFRKKLAPVDIGEVETIQTVWWDRHPAAYAHAGMHAIWLSWVFGWAAIPLAITHLIIDCRWVVVQWSKLIGQTPSTVFMVNKPGQGRERVALMDMGTVVRIWVDQVFHIACIAVAAVLVTL